MFITPHTSAAIWITTKVNNPYLAFVLALISHFILDIIPHGDESLGDYKQTKKSKFLYFLKVSLVDVIMASLLVVLYINKEVNTDKALLSMAVLGAWLPDLAWISIETFKIKFLYWYLRFHTRIHSLINWRYSLVYGVPFQIIFTILLLKISF